MNIKVLGGGCCKCENLLEAVKAAVAEKGVDAEIEYITDMAQIMEYGIMSTPALMVDSKVVSMGRVLKVKDYISKNYMNEIRLNDVASLAGMSPSAFSRFFKLHTGRNLSDYIIDMRLGYASRMLVDSTHSIAEIGYGCGFNNLSNFNRIFKKKKGCSPSEFRENYHKTRIIV